MSAIVCPGCGARVPDVEEGPAELPRLRQRMAPPKRVLPWLTPPASLGELTVADVHAAATPEAHRETVERWARSAWAAWSPHHAQVHAWADELDRP